MEIAATLATFLSPFLPHLMNLGQQVSEEAGKALGARLGEGTWNKAKQIWEKILPKINEQPLAKGAVEALAEDTQDEDAQNILAKQLKKLLEAKPALAQELHALVTEDEEVISQGVSITQNVQGNKNIVIGLSNSSSFNIE